MTRDVQIYSASQNFQFALNAVARSKELVKKHLDEAEQAQRRLMYSERELVLAEKWLITARVILKKLHEDEEDGA